MILPDQLSQEYARLLPELKKLGYRADLKPSLDSERFLLTVSRKPTTRVYSDGTWERDDGQSGDDPTDLLALYKGERQAEVRKNYKTDDINGIAYDVLSLSERNVSVIVSVEQDGDDLEVLYRPYSGCPQSARIYNARQRIVALLDEL